MAKRYGRSLTWFYAAQVHVGTKTREAAGCNIVKLRAHPALARRKRKLDLALAVGLAKMASEKVIYCSEDETSDGAVHETIDCAD